MTTSIDFKHGKRFDATDEYLYVKKIEELESALKLAIEALEEIIDIDLETHKRHPEYEGQFSEYAEYAIKALAKIRKMRGEP